MRDRLKLQYLRILLSLKQKENQAHISLDPNFISLIYTTSFCKIVFSSFVTDFEPRKNPCCVN